MQLAPFTTLNWAYQLHYYICFRTHRRRECFAEDRNAETLISALTEICQRHDYHLLDSKVYPNHFRCLLSLRPDQAVSTTVQTIKTNSSRECNQQLGLAAPLWARGYLARSVGRAPISIVKQYLDQQSEHHGYSELGNALGEYWLKVAEKHGFAIDRMTILPDHTHLLVRIAPTISIADCVMALLNNGQYYIGKYKPIAMIEADVDQLWQSSAYAGTRGEFTTSLIKHWLSERE